jgi:hypothetical protein
MNTNPYKMNLTNGSGFNLSSKRGGGLPMGSANTDFAE